jgi:ankyrin repeat protein
MRGMFVVASMSALIAACYLTSLVHKAKLDASLVMAVHNGNYAEVKRLLNQGADANAKDFEDLHSLVAAQILGITVGNQPRPSALIEAAAKGDTKLVALLIERGADVNRPCLYQPPHAEGYAVVETTALVEASAEGNTDTVALLIQHGANVNFHQRYQPPNSGRLDSDYITALHLAKYYKHVAVAKLLARAGATDH